MKKILYNSSLFILFILCFIFKDKIIDILNNDDIKINNNEISINYYKDELNKVLKDIDNDIIDIKNTYARIINRNIYDFYNKLLINKGSNNGIKKDDLVVYKNSLIGIVDKTFTNSSIVNLLYNKDIKLSVKINDIYGVLESKNNKLYIKNLINDSNINIGDCVYTSGLTNIKANILIGKVNDIKISKDEIEKIVEVKLINNIDNINYVYIMSNEEI